MRSDGATRRVSVSVATNQKLIRGAAIRHVENTASTTQLYPNTTPGTPYTRPGCNTAGPAGDRGTYGRRSDFADPRFLGYRSYFVDVGEGVGELLPAGLEHRTLRRGHELLELRRAHRCTAVRDEARRW